MFDQFFDALRNIIYGDSMWTLAFQLWAAALLGYCGGLGLRLLFRLAKRKKVDEVQKSII